MNYIKDEKSGKVYQEELLNTIPAVDPFHFDTEVQLSNDRIESLKKQIEDEMANQKQITINKEDFFKQFPELLK